MWTFLKNWAQWKNSFFCSHLKYWKTQQMGLFILLPNNKDWLYQHFQYQKNLIHLSLPHSLVVKIIFSEPLYRKFGYSDLYISHSKQSTLVSHLAKR